MRIWLVSLAACGAATQVPVEIVTVTAASATGTPATTERDDLAPPWTLTASDGSGLALVRVDAKAVIEGPLAYTELHLYFANAEDRTREGTFQITLPARAAVSRFAMESAGQWLEAEVVPRLVARRAYDDFLHRRQDPALLEKAAGNQFTAKVFPIAPASEKHVVISYGEELPGARYVLPLRGLPTVPRVDVELAVTSADGARTTQRLAERAWRPDRDFVSAQAASAAAVGAGTLVAAQVELAGGAARDVPRGITLVVDTSASRALGFARYLAGVRAVIAGLARDLPLDVVAFDQDSELVFAGRAGDFGDAELRALVARGAAGASDLGQALARRLQPRVVLVGDAVVTAGVEGRELAALLAGVDRVDVVLAGGLRDDAAATRLARAGKRAGAVFDLERDRIALDEAVATEIAIAVPGATWVYPRTVASARAGTHVMVYARLPRPAPAIEVLAGGARRSLRVLAGTPPLVERAFAGAELAELEATVPTLRGDAAAALRRTIARKSVAARVLASETAMLVLEHDVDYARYGLARGGLADVLVVGPRGLERVHRDDPPPVPGHASPPLPPPESPDGLAPPPPPSPALQVDHDHDAILDDSDGCPDEPETRNGLDDGDGCPDRGRVIMTSTSIEILEPVYFAAERDAIDARAFPILDAVAATLQRNPDIAALEIQGHTDERGDDARNLELSERRANAVMAYLVGKGVDARRLSARGYGASQPLARGHSELAWAKNRRVAFLILRRDAEASTRREPVTGELAAIERALAAHDVAAAEATARAWHAREPGNVLALVGLGEALEARHATAGAARAYGSIIDLFPGRADLRRFAGERLARLGPSPLVIDTFRRAVADRPDHLTGHRLLAYALVRAGRLPEAFAAIVGALDRTYRGDSYAGGRRVLGDDAAMIGAAYAATVPASRREVARVLARHQLALATQPSTRFVLYWETDANDVDFHIRDARGGHAFYSQKQLASGGELYADITTGYGPECFAIPGTPAAGPYQLSIEYYSQGPMGYGMGVVEIETFDPVRGFTFEDRPYVVMTDHARVDLGTYR